MRIVKRYSNRKLYDTEERRYITLDDVSRLIQGGVDVKVQDNVSGEDLTAITLSQILLEKQKSNKKGSLSKAFLATMLKSGAKLREEVLEKGGKVVEKGGKYLESGLKSLNMPGRDEFDALSKTVANLEKSMERIEKQLGAKKKPAAKKKKK